jgi:DNA-binding GntR family transcriptional regulator
MTMVEPMYLQIAEDLRHQIEAGELAPGDQVLTELELRERYGASRNTHRASAGISAELQIEEGAAVISRRQQRHASGAAWSLRTVFCPIRLVEQGAHRLLETGSIIGGAVNYPQATLGIRLAGWPERITVRVPSTTECTFFQLPGDGRVSVIESRRTGCDSTGKPFVVIGRVYPADRNELVINVGLTPAGEAKSPGGLSG